MPLAGEAGAPPTDTARLAGTAGVSGTAVSAELLATGAGTAHVYVWDPVAGTLGDREVAVPGAGVVPVTVPVDPAKLTGGSVLLVAFEASAGGTRSSAAAVGG